MLDSPTIRHLKKGYTLHVHTAGGRRDTPCTSILLAVERDTPCTFILLAVEEETPFTSILLAVEMDKQASQIDLRFCCRHNANFWDTI